MIRLKRVWTILLAAILLLGLTVPVCAEEAATPFTGRLSVKANPTDIETGKTVELRAQVTEANLDYSLQWERWGKPENENEEKWIPIGGATAATYKFTANEPSYQFRAVLTATDGTVVTASIKIQPKPPAGISSGHSGRYDGFWRSLWIRRCSIAPGR